MRTLGTLACAVLLACGSPRGYQEPVAAAAAPSSAGQERPAPSPAVRPGAAAAAPHAAAPVPAASPAPQPQPAGPSAAAAATSAAAAATAVIVNGTQLAEPDLRELEARLGARPEPGRYWYDAQSGLWGLAGHGASGLTQPRLRAATLPRAGSSGGTEVLVNGRELTATELRDLARLLDWPREGLRGFAGRYSLDDRGGLYGPSNRYLGNLVQAAARTHADAGPPSAAECVWLHLGSDRGALGRVVTVACD